MKKWPVISPSPQTPLPRWTYCGHFKAVGKASQGLVFWGGVTPPPHFQCLGINYHSSGSSWPDTPAKRSGQWLVSGEGPEWHVGKSTLFNTLLFGSFGGILHSAVK